MASSDNKPTTAEQRKAAIELARQKVMAAYRGNSDNYVEVEEKSAAPKKKSEPEQQDVYAQTLSETKEAPKIDPEEWKQYHSAWQNYYQKYYEQYYTAAAKKVSESSAKSDMKGGKRNKKILDELRKNIQENASDSAEKVRKSRHLIPILAGVAVVLIFVFLQYNRFFFATVKAYVMPGNTDGSGIVELDPTLTTSVGPEPKLIIPKINVEVPIVFGVGNDQKSQLDAMVKGVSHFAIPGADARPGQVGNTVLSGHSSNDLFDQGNYKFIFAQLERMDEGDTVYINYKGERFTYAVVRKEVVLPTDVKKLVYKTTKPMLTLITCVPLGTANKRLLVTAEQINPNPNNATTKPDDEPETEAEEEKMPSNSPTFLEKVINFFLGR